MPEAKDFDQLGGINRFELRILDLLRKGNLALADLLLQESLAGDPHNSRTMYLLGWVATAVNVPHVAQRCFGEAAQRMPDWQAARVSLEKARMYRPGGSTQFATDNPAATSSTDRPAFLLIKAWGYGFWADVSHVLGQLLVAEMTGRIPIVHWGLNSLFGDGTGRNAFEFYFDRVSDFDVNDLERDDYDYWPPKWNRSNLLAPKINKWQGPFSRVAGLYLLGRAERVVVSDFHTGVIDLIPWIPPGNPLHGRSVDEVYRYLVNRYLRPRQEILDAVDAFRAKQLSSPDFIAVHARGSDKQSEVHDLEAINRQYREVIDLCLGAHDCSRVFLMTDDARILEEFAALYRDKIVVTDCQRTRDATGIHYHAVNDRRRLGTEMMIDTYVAAGARAFVGNGSSNPSLAVRYLRDWPDGSVFLIGRSRYHTANTFLHDW